MAVTLTVNGVSKKERMIERSLSWTNVLNGRDTLQVSFREHYQNPASAEDGAIIALTDGGVAVFGGIVAAPRVEQEGLSDFLIYRCQAQDYSAILERRVVAASYENKTLLEIVTGINTDFLDGEGITLGAVETGPTFAKVVFNYVYAMQAANELSELSGLTHWIDPLKVWNFKQRASVLAPTAVTDTNYVSMAVTVARETYRNKQLVRAGVDLTDPRTDSFKGDGTNRVFNVAFPVGKVPSSVTVNAVPKTIGILGVETGKDFYWNKSKTEIVQDSAGTVLTASDTLAVTYQGQFPLLVSAQDDTEILARAAKETGTSGTYEHVEDRPHIDSDDLANETAQKLLSRHGRITRVIELTTLVPGYRAGQLVTIVNTKHQLNGQFLIDSVSASEWTEADNAGEPRLMYSVRALEGDFQGGWVAFFQRLAELGRQFVIRENEVLVLLRSQRDEVYCHDVLTAISATPEDRVDVARVDYAEVA